MQIDNSCFERWLSPMTYDLHRFIRADRELMWDYLEFAYHQLDDFDCLANLAEELRSKVLSDYRLNGRFSGESLERVIWSDLASAFADQVA